MLDDRRRACLSAMGVDVWVARNDVAAPAIAATESDTATTRESDVSAARPDAVPPPGSAALSPPTAESRLVSQNAFADAVPAALDTPCSDLDWSELQARVANCHACGLHENRTQTVFGVGDRQADLMVIGEAPGADEDRQGEPFVGRAGQLLNAMLSAIGFAREQVYIANIVKCRPPGNRDPHVEEAAACQPYLQRQIALMEPKLILAVGRVSAHNLLGSDEAVGRLRGRTHRIDPGDIPVIVTYHPAYLLRRPQEKSKSWQDLQAAWRVLNSA